MSKEALARAANSDNLEMEAGVIHDADRLAAMAGGNTLGGYLLRFREGEQGQWAQRIALILVARVVRTYKLGRALATRLVVLAMAEFSQPQCVTCGGARELMFDQVVITCEDCHGSGLQQRDDDARRSFIGAYSKRIDDAMAACHRWMTDALTAYMRRAEGRLV